MAVLDKTDIESLYFEYRKMEALMELGVGFSLDGLFAHNKTAEKYINSLLLIDLFSVVDKAVDFVFDDLKLKQQKKKSKLQVLIDLGKVRSHEYLKWYKEWRNDAAHSFLKVESFLLRQASKDIQYQFLDWGIIDDLYHVTPYSSKTGENEFQYGAYIGDVPILLFQHLYREFEGSRPMRSTYHEAVNLSLVDYKKLPKPKEESNSVELNEFLESINNVRTNL